MKTTIKKFMKRHSRGISSLGLGLALAIVLSTGYSGILRADALSSVSPSAPVADATASSKAPAWELTDVDGKTVKSSDFAGKVVILDFWATWCPPCKAEIPGFIDLQKKYGDKGVAVIGVSLDQEGPSTVKPFMNQLGINYPVVMGDDKIVQDFGGIEGVPTTFIIDRSGNEVSKHVGYGDEEAFETEIKPLI
jgi:thiol-disulfide isomerase/thioredoxin